MERVKNRSQGYLSRSKENPIVVDGELAGRKRELSRIKKVARGGDGEHTATIRRLHAEGCLVDLEFLSTCMASFLFFFYSVFLISTFFLPEFACSAGE